jgi:hypothetical protein
MAPPSREASMSNLRPLPVTDAVVVRDLIRRAIYRSVDPAARVKLDDAALEHVIDEIGVPIVDGGRQVGVLALDALRWVDGVVGGRLQLDGHPHLVLEYECPGWQLVGEIVQPADSRMLGEARDAVRWLAEATRP